MLRVGAITKDYVTVRALDDVSFSVRRGQIVGFLGPNGAGKTTAMRAVMGLITTDQGAITWDGQPIGPAVRHRIGYLPAERGRYPRMRVRDQLRYYTRLSGLSGDAASEAADRWIERLELGAYASEVVQSLSSGNQQRVQLGMALAAAPDLLLLDEPFSGLDPVAVAALSDTLRGEADRGAAVLLSSHQLDLVAALCSSVVVVNHGRVVLTGEVTALRAASSTRILHVAFTDPTPWDPDGVDVRPDGANGYEIRLEERRDVRDLLADAMASGTVASYSYRPPDLSEIFLTAITTPAHA
jgi:ABC-2 type transport system ATP-binding protein